MSKFTEILNGFKNLVWESPRIEKLATDRALICSDCSSNIDSRCKECGCFLVAKIRSEYSKCPLSKW